MWKIFQTEYCMVKKEIIETLVDRIACPQCFEIKMKFLFTNLHCDTYFKVLCKHCGSKVIDTAPHCVVPGKKVYEL